MGYPWSTGDQANAADVNDIVKFGGDGSDGALDTSGGTVDIDLGGAEVVVKNYTSINIATNNLTFSNPATKGTTVILKSQGNVTISATVDLTGIGGQGGAGGAAASSGQNNGSNGNDSDEILDTNDHFGAGATGKTQGAAGSAFTMTGVGLLYSIAVNYIRRLRGHYIVPGAGGGGASSGQFGSSGQGGAGGDGGDGGGALIIECWGAYNFTGTINAAGGDGGDGSNGSGDSGDGGGGGGGAGGFILVIYNTLTADSGTYTVTAGGAGTGATGGAGGTGVDGGGGGGGAGMLSNAGSAGQAGDDTTPSDGGDGGAGSAGIAVRVANEWFA